MNVLVRSGISYGLRIRYEDKIMHSQVAEDKMFGAKTEDKMFGDKAVTARSPCLVDSKSTRHVRRTELEAGKRRRGPM